MSSVSRTAIVLSCVFACAAPSLAPSSARAKNGWIEQIGEQRHDRHQESQVRTYDIVELLTAPATRESWKQLEAFGLPYIEGIPPIAVLFPQNADAD